jgi:sialic acid synthase
VKFQKSSLTDKFTAAALQRPYTSVNSFGTTYGDHKRFLEFSIEQYKELQSYAAELGILFTASAMDPQSLKDLIQLDVPFIKIGSGDANNFPMLHQAAVQPKPLIISTGMQTMATIEKIHQIMVENGKKNFCLMHCISSYPTKPEHVYLRYIEKFKQLFPKTPIGYSGHEDGISVSIGAVAMGAKVIERHFTLDRAMKGTDHSASLTPDLFEQLVKSIRLCEGESQHPQYSKAFILEKVKMSMPPNIFSQERVVCNLNEALADIAERKVFDCELPCRLKLGKSLVYSENLAVNHIIGAQDLCVKVSGGSLSAELFYTVIGQRLVKAVFQDTSVCDDDFVAN